MEGIPKNISVLVLNLEDILSFGNYSESRGLRAKIPSAKFIQFLQIVGTIVPMITAIIAIIQNV